MTAIQDVPDTLPPGVAGLRAVLSKFPGLSLALVFGSVAKRRARADSDLDVAVLGPAPLDSSTKMALMAALAGSTGRAVDLVDLATVPEPLLGEIVRTGYRLLGSDEAFARLLSRHLVEQADFMPYQMRVLEERCQSWTGR